MLLDVDHPGTLTSRSNLAYWSRVAGNVEEAISGFSQLADERTQCLGLSHSDTLATRGDLASSLSNLGILFSVLESPAEALSYMQEAVTIRRELVEADPVRYRRDLACSLNNLGVLFTELDRPVDALPAILKSIAIYREPVQTAQVASWRLSEQVHLLWSFRGRRTIHASAKLRVLSPSVLAASTSFVYSCR